MKSFRDNLAVRLLTAALLALAAGAAGCVQPVMDAINQISGHGGEDDALYTTAAARDKGLVIVLHGVEGKSNANEGIRQGLIAAGVNDAISIIPWGASIPLVKTVVNEVNAYGNRADGQRIADAVLAYQDRYPGRPVTLIGHSAGAGIAVFAAECLPAGRQVDAIIMIAPSLSASYDLAPALARTRKGILNFHNRTDTVALGVGTTVFGTIDGSRGPSAGLGGFDRPSPNDSLERLAAYRRLFQVDLTPASSVTGASVGSHFAATAPSFVSTYVAPWVQSPHWPVSMPLND